MLENAIRKVIKAGWTKEEIFDYVERILEEDKQEAKIKEARENVAAATAEYVKLLTGKDVDIADFLKDFIMMEESIKEVDPVETKETNKKRDAVNEWLKENGLLF